MIIQKRLRNGKVNWKTSNKPTHSENYVESMENQLSSSGQFSQHVHHWRFLKEIQEDSNDRKIKPEQLEGRILFMSMFNDIAWTSKGNSSDCVSNSEKERDYAKGFRKDTGHSSVLEKKINGMERALINLKENGTEV